MPNDHMEYAIGVDVGGTKINAGVVNQQGEILFHETIPTLAGETNVIDQMSKVIQTILDRVKLQFPQLHITGIGVGTAGQVDWETGSIRFASDLIPGYTGTPVKRLLEQQFGIPAIIDNDVNVLAWTEKKLGAGRDAKNLICLALGTGVGGAIMVDGRILHGKWGGAGEIGHLSVDFNGLPCVCGGIGCLEQYASGTGIAARMQKKLANQNLSKAQDVSAIDARDVFALWHKGDPLASEVMDETFVALGAAIASLAHTFNPEVMIIGGGVAEVGNPLFERIREEAGKRAMGSFMESMQIVPAYKGNWSGMIGAALQIWEYT